MAQPEGARVGATWSASPPSGGAAASRSAADSKDRERFLLFITLLGNVVVPVGIGAMGLDLPDAVFAVLVFAGCANLALLVVLMVTRAVEIVRTGLALVIAASFIVIGATTSLAALTGPWGIVVPYMLGRLVGNRVGFLSGVAMIVAAWAAYATDGGAVGGDPRTSLESVVTATMGLSLFSLLSFVAHRNDATEKQQLSTRVDELARTREELARANDELSASAAFNDELFATMPGALFVVDETRRVRRTNAACDELMGCHGRALVGSDITTLFRVLGDDVAAGPLLPAGPHVERTERIAVCPDGTTTPVLVSVKETSARSGQKGWVVIALDLTEAKALELKLRQSQKLEAVGRLAAGVAHEINTPTQFVKDSVEFAQSAVRGYETLVTVYDHLVSRVRDRLSADEVELLERARDDADLEYTSTNLPKAITRALEGLDRIASIVKSMRTFAHPGGAEMGSVSINDAILSTLIMARSEYKLVAEIATDLRELPPVKCYPHEVNQVFLNLLVNAAQAIEDKVKGTAERGVITIRTERVGENVVVTMADTGGGIPTEAVPHVFEPFFTTKGQGRGTGQGLAIARSVIVDRHGGDLTFTTSPGEGTTFTIVLPLEPPRKLDLERAA